MVSEDKRNVDTKETHRLKQASAQPSASLACRGQVIEDQMWTESGGEGLRRAAGERGRKRGAGGDAGSHYERLAEQTVGRGGGRRKTGEAKGGRKRIRCGCR